MLDGELFKNRVLAGLPRQERALLLPACEQTVSQRMARWLKAHWHRTGIETFPFSASFLAAQVGADSNIVSDVLKAFHEENIVKSGHNKVTIMDQDKLSKEACECYGLAKQAADEYLGALADIARTHADA